MKKGIKLSFVFLLLFVLPVFSYEVPKPKPYEIIVLTQNEDQLEAMLSIENYGAKCSPEGVCYGIDRINYTLLTKINFISGQRESNSKIRKKLLTAYYENTPQAIQGFDSIETFMDTMEDEWDKKNNPLKKAIEKIQITQPPYKLFEQKVEKNTHLLKEGLSILEEEAQDFEDFILEGVPVPIAITNAKSAHQLTLIGFKQNILKDKEVKDFYVLDSNYPDELQILRLKRNSWYYKPWSQDVGNGYIDLLWDIPPEEDIALAHQIFKPYYSFDPSVLTYFNLAIIPKLLYHY